MSADKTSQEWHLAPEGWLIGTFKVYDDVQTHVEPPLDRIETWVENTFQSSSFSQIDVTRERVWVSDKLSEGERKTLNARYPRPF